MSSVNCDNVSLTNRKSSFGFYQWILFNVILNSVEFDNTYGIEDVNNYLNCFVRLYNILFKRREK